jgi:hypothetical protein
VADVNHGNIIVKKIDTFQNDKIEFVKKVLTSINKKFKVDNILGIAEISFNFDFEIPQNDTFKFPNDIALYTPSKDANLLEVVNNLIWLYLCHKEDFNKKLKQFDKFIQTAEAQEGYLFLYPAYHKIHMGILDKIIAKSDCEGNNFEEFQTLFYSQYGIDLKEYLDKKPTHEEVILDDPTDEQSNNTKRSPETIYKENQINSNKNKILANITRPDEFNPENRKITFNITTSQPIHKFIKLFSSYIEINPLLNKEELHALLDQYYGIYNEFQEMLIDFNTEVVSTEDNKFLYKINPTYDIKSDAPTTFKGVEAFKKSMIILMIMEYYQIDNFETAIRYFNYYLMKENYQSIQFEDSSLFDFLNSDEYDRIDGKISLKNQNNINPINSGKSKQSYIKLSKFLKQYL